MKFVYRGNVLNYHTKTIADALYNILGDNVVFIIDNPNVTIRSDLYDRGDMTDVCPYALNMDESELSRKKGQGLIDNCDVLFTLACYSKQFVDRMRQKNNNIL